MNFTCLKVDKSLYEGACVTVVIQREAALNALNLQVLSELDKVVEEITGDEKVRVLVLRGAGDKAFVAGADISEMSKMSPAEAFQFSKKGQEVFRKLEDLHCVTMAVVQGYALGGGLELAMSCDLMLVTEKARVGQPEVGLGLIPGFGGTQRLIDRVGSPLAMSMLLAGKNLEGEEIVKQGLASELVVSSELEGAVAAMVKKILRAGPRANAVCKRMARVSRIDSLTRGLEAEAQAFSELFASTETQEGLSAFLQKRSASFVKKC